MTKSADGEVFMTKDELRKENERVMYAWGNGNGGYLGFNLKHFIKLADEKHISLWHEMLKVDAIEDREKKRHAMHKLLLKLLK